MDNCHQCGEQGIVGPPLLADEFEIGLDAVNNYIDRMTDDEDDTPMLFRHGEHYYCYPCHCLLNYVCIQCDSEVDYLFRDKRCKSPSYVCETCLKKPRVNHLWRCYRTGCISIEEIAQDEFEMLQHEDTI